MKLRLMERRLKTLANEKRLHILHFLKRRRSATVGVIAKEVGLSFRGTSQHLAILLAASVLERRKRGMHVAYRLSLHQEPPVKGILKLL